MKNKSVLITGAARRIGREIALSMAENGWNVVVHYNSSSKDAKKLVGEIKKLGVMAVSIKADLSKKKQVRMLFDESNKHVGEIVCLVNNASVLENDNLHSLTEESWVANVDVNLYAPLVLSQGFVKQLKEGSKGNIINMLDYCVWSLPEKFLSYSLSKYALWGATQMLAKQLAPNVRVNGIGPGHSMPNKRESKKNFNQAREKTPLQNGADSDEICRAVEFILNSPSMTGQMLALDGGKHLIGADFY